MILWRRLAASLLSVSILSTQCVLVHSYEINLWKERRASQQFAPLPRNLNVIPVKTGYGDDVIGSLIGAIPQSLATIQDVYQSIDKSNPPVVLIQDVHMNDEAQAHIAGVIQNLIDAKQVGRVAIEGAFESLDFAPFRAIAEKDVVRFVADSFLKNNKLGAPSYVGVTSALAPPVFVGVDDKFHYEKNVQAYLDSIPLKEKAVATLEQEARDLFSQKASHFTGNLKRFDHLYSAYHQGDLGIGAYVKELQTIHPEIDFVLAQFVEAFDMETSLRFNQVDREKEMFLQELTKTLTERELNTLMNNSLSYKLGLMSMGTFFTQLKTLCEKKGVHLSQAPAFENYIRYVLLADGIRSDKLFSSLATYEDTLIRKLAVTAEENNLWARSEINLLSKKLVEFSLTYEEWKKLQSIDDRLWALDRKNFKPFENFYSEADIRSEKMTASILGHDDRPMVLVVGGFHTALITESLRKQNRSYVVVSPKISKITDETGSAYLSIFAQEKTPLDKLFKGQTLFLKPSVQEISDPRTFARFMGSIQARVGSLGGRSDQLIVRKVIDPAGDQYELKRELFAVVGEMSYVAPLALFVFLRPALLSTSADLAIMWILNIGLALYFAYKHQWQEVSHLVKRSENPSSVEEKPGISAVLEAYSNLQEVPVSDSDGSVKDGEDNLIPSSIAPASILPIMKWWYVVFLAPIWESMVFHSNFIFTGYWWGVMVFSAAHIAVSWAVRAWNNEKIFRWNDISRFVRLLPVAVLFFFVGSWNFDYALPSVIATHAFYNAFVLFVKNRKVQNKFYYVLYKWLVSAYVWGHENLMDPSMVIVEKQMDSAKQGLRLGFEGRSKIFSQAIENWISSDGSTVINVFTDGGIPYEFRFSVVDSENKKYEISFHRNGQKHGFVHFQMLNYPDGELVVRIFTAFKEFWWTQNHTARFEAIFVDEEFSRFRNGNVKGVGGSLLSLVEHYSYKRGVRRILIDGVAESLREKFYGPHGYRLTNDPDFFSEEYGSRVEKIISETNLARFGVKRIAEINSQAVSAILASPWMIGVILIGFAAFAIRNYSGVNTVQIISMVVILVTITIPVFFASMLWTVKSGIPMAVRFFGNADATGPPIFLFGRSATAKQSVNAIEYDEKSQSFRVSTHLYNLLSHWSFPVRFFTHFILNALFIPIHERGHAWGIRGEWGAYSSQVLPVLVLVQVAWFVSPLTFIGLWVAMSSLPALWSAQKNAAVGKERTLPDALSEQKREKILLSAVKKWVDGDGGAIVVKAPDGAEFKFVYQRVGLFNLKHTISAYSGKNKVGYIHFKRGWPRYMVIHKRFLFRNTVWNSPRDRSAIRAVGLENEKGQPYKGLGTTLMGLAERFSYLSGDLTFYAREVSGKTNVGFYHGLGYRKTPKQVYSKGFFEMKKELFPEKLSPVRIYLGRPSAEQAAQKLALTASALLNGHIGQLMEIRSLGLGEVNRLANDQAAKFLFQLNAQAQNPIFREELIDALKGKASGKFSSEEELHRFVDLLLAIVASKNISPEKSNSMFMFRGKAEGEELQNRERAVYLGVLRAGEDGRVQFVVDEAARVNIERSLQLMSRFGLDVTRVALASRDDLFTRPVVNVELLKKEFGNPTLIVVPDGMRPVDAPSFVIAFEEWIAPLAALDLSSLLKTLRAALIAA